MDRHRTKYLATHNSVTAKAEARIYAAARTMIYLLFLQDEITDFSIEQINHIIVSSVSALLDLPEDDVEIHTFLQRKIMQHNAAAHQNLLLENSKYL